MADRPTPGSSRFESDLRAIREARSVPLADVQQQTRIPTDVLERFEAGRLVGDPNYNEVYLKALVRSYADAIGLAPAEVLGAYEAQKGEAYRGGLRQHLGEEAAAPPAASAPPPPAEPPPVDAPADAPPSPPRSETLPPAAAGAPPAVEALRRAPAPVERTPPQPVREEKVRVQSHREASVTTTPIDRSWGMIIGLTVLGVLGIGLVLWFLLLRPEDGLEPIERPRTADADTAFVAEPVDTLAAPAAAPVSDAPRLQTPIVVTLLAEGGPLQNFRVTEEPDARRPYWIEAGDSQEFRSEQGVVIWGTGGDGNFTMPGAARLRLQGYTWQPTRSPVRIDAQRGQALLDSLHRAQRGTAPVGAPTGGQPPAGAPPAGTPPAPAAPAPASPPPAG